MTDIFSLSLVDLAEKIKNGHLSSVEVCQTYIDRIKKFEKDIKAWAHFDKKVLLEKATEADEHRRAGKPTGSLHGVPIAVKDIIGTVDMPTECGTVIRKGKSYSQNAEIIDLLHASGAIVMGKTATSELAYLGPPATTNPHDKDRTPGGSSSGSAASVASFMASTSTPGGRTASRVTSSTCSRSKSIRLLREKFSQKRSPFSALHAAARSRRRSMEGGASTRRPRTRRAPTT